MNIFQVVVIVVCSTGLAVAITWMCHEIKTYRSGKGKDD